MQTQVQSEQERLLNASVDVRVGVVPGHGCPVGEAVRASGVSRSSAGSRHRTHMSVQAEWHPGWRSGTCSRSSGEGRQGTAAHVRDEDLQTFP